MRSASALVVVLLLSLAAAGAGGAARGPTPGATGERAVPGELIVTFRAGVSEAERQQALRRAGVREKKRLTRNGRVKLAQAASADAALKRLASDPRIAFAEPNFVVQALGVPNDPSFGQLWGLVNTGQVVDGARGVADADIDAELAWDVTTGSSGVAVGVIDTGVDFSHPDLAGARWTNSGETGSGREANGVDDDGNGYVDDWRGWDFVNEDNNAFDDHGHGTHVSGTIGARGNNGVGVVGVDWSVKVAALKFLDAEGSGTTADAIRAIDYATAEGIRISNNSWGGGGYSQALLDAIERAGAAGGLVVAAAGNDAFDNDELPSYPASYASPAVLSVAASDSSDRLAAFSNWGRTSVDLAAPGVGIYSTLPGGGYDWWSGTSMATPHVAGAAALAQARFPDATGMGLKALLLSTVDPVSALADTSTGGRLNVNGAVRCSAAPTVWLEQPLAGFEATAGEPLDVVALGASCASPGAVVTAVANGTSFPLTHRGDGLWRGAVTPSSEGPLTIAVTAAAGGTSATRSVSGSALENYRVTEEPFAWIDATAGGTNTGLNVDDGSVTVQLPFQFSLYGESFGSVKISSNGYLVLGASAASPWDNQRLPDGLEPQGMVAPFWDDLRPVSRGTIWHRTVGTAPNRRFVVAWIGVPHYYNVGDSTFEVVLEEATGELVFQYRDVDFGDEFLDLGASATVGVESADGRRGRTIFHEQAALGRYQNATAFRLTLGAADATPPQTSLDGGPWGVTAETAARFSFSSSEAGSSFECQLDGSAWDVCGSPKDYSGLSAGEHVFRVRAADAAGNVDATPAERAWTIDPRRNLIANGSFEGSLEGWAAHQATAGLAPGPVGAQAARLTLRPGFSYLSFRTEPAAVRGIVAGQSYEARALVRSDTPGGRICLNVRELRGDGSGVANVTRCVTATGAWQPFPAVAYTTTAEGGSLVVFVSQANAPAGASFDVDDVGLRSDSTDTTPPETTIDSGPSGTTTATTASFAFSSDETASGFQCQLDTAAWEACTSPSGYEGLALGEHVFRVRATDPAGNTDPTPAERSWTVAQPSNLLPNGSFEDGLAGWATHQATAAQVSGSVGAHAARVAVRPGFTYASYRTDPAPVAAVPAGAVYEASALVRSDTPGGQVCLNVRELAVDGSGVANATRCLTATGEWQRFPTLTYTTRTSDSSLIVYASQANAATGASFDLDDVSLVAR